jgi:protein TonB
MGTVAESNPASTPAPEVRDSVIEPTKGSGENSGDLSAQPVSPSTMATLPSARPNADSNRYVSSSATKNATSRNPVETPEEVVVEEPAKKPKLGAVRLAAPKVMRGAESETGTADPGLVINSVTAADSTGASMLTNKGKGPAAPLPVGGDVKVAKLISSVPPVYPQMARTQRASGDVTIDALIDGTGRVTATRVLSGPALLHDAATNAVRQWKYQPATLNGVPTATHLTVTVQFRLQ